MALGALIHLVDQLVINEIIGKVDPMETQREIVNAFEVFMCTAVA